MAMLAEPKRKMKWALNPRGKLWVNDESKIGQKLLEKMGWSKGKGLGASEQGDLEPIRIKYKNDAEGVGFKVKDDQWVAHGEEFNAVLGQLNGVQADVSDRIGFKQDQGTATITIHSLEKRSKSSKARVHYHKFTRGKDLSRYSATDMASILGKRPAAEETVEVKEEMVEETLQTEDHSHGVTTIPKGNLNDYFASKMAALREKQNRQQQDQVSEEETTPRRVRFDESLNEVKEFCSKDKIVINDDVENPVVIDGSSTVNKKSKKDKSKKKNRPEQCLADEVGEAVLLEVEPEPLTKKQKKKKAKAVQEEVELAVVTAESTMDSSNITKKKKKKKNKKMSDDGNEEELVDSPAAEVVEHAQSEVVAESTEANGKKKKKKDKKNKAFAAEQQVEETPTESPHQPEEEKTFKRKKSGDDDHESTEIPQKKKKKKNRQEIGDAVAETSATPTVVEETTEIKTEKRKKKKMKEEPIESIEEQPIEPPTKKKKKSKKDAVEESEARAQAKTEDVEKDQQAANIEIGMKQYWLGKEVEEKAALVKMTKDRLIETRKKIDRAYAITDCRTPSLLVSRKCSNSEQFAHLNPDLNFFSGRRLKDVLHQFEEVDLTKFKGANLHLIPGYGTLLK